MDKGGKQCLATTTTGNNKAAGRRRPKKRRPREPTNLEAASEPLWQPPQLRSVDLIGVPATPTTSGLDFAQQQLASTIYHSSSGGSSSQQATGVGWAPRHFYASQFASSLHGLSAVASALHKTGAVQHLIHQAGAMFQQRQTAGDHLNQTQLQLSTSKAAASPILPQEAITGSHHQSMINHHRSHRRHSRKCRKIYGIERRSMWCTQCKWKKACSRFSMGATVVPTTIDPMQVAAAGHLMDHLHRHHQHQRQHHHLHRPVRRPQVSLGDSTLSTTSGSR